MTRDYKSLEEREIILLIVEKGESEAYSALVKRHQGRLYATAVGILRDEGDAAEAVQEAFLRAYESLCNFRGGASFYSWAHRILVNVCIDRLRERGRAEMREFDDELAEDSLRSLSEAVGGMGDDPFEGAYRAELAALISDALSNLDEKHRMIVILREVEEMSYKEIAEALGIGIGTVMSRLFHARKKLCEILGAKLTR
ncbi:MAG: sigma-70 family RNA polymerase sigma factor [Myxococcota bacterium]